MTQTDANLLGEKLSVLGKKWVLREGNERQVTFYKQKYDLPEIIARILVSRGIQEQHLSSYLSPALKTLLPDPYHLKDMEKAVHRLEAALKNQQKIAIFGDYDVDGATSSALLKRYLQNLGVEATLCIPDRIEDGYGPTPKLFNQLKDTGHDLIITVDCGTTAFEALETAKALNLDVIILDHHIPSPKFPAAVAFVNPNRLDQVSPCTMCAAVGVTFLFVVAMQSHLKKQGFFATRPEPDLLQYLDLVATGTICDVVPLEGLNRAFVKQGLKVLSRRKNIGLRALLESSNLDTLPTTYHLGFILGPRINAGGRVGEASLGARLLSTEDPFEATQMAGHLSRYNEERQRIETEVLAKAVPLAQAQEGPLVMVGSDGWHPGVIGIVAGRLKEMFHKPSIVISFDETGLGKGSARSIPGLDMGSLIQAGHQVGLVVSGGGHPMAGGLTVKKDKLEALQDFFHQRILKQSLSLTPSVKLDAFLSLKGVSPELIEKLDLLEPYGQGHPAPRFLFEEVRVLKATPVGTNHIRCLLGSFGEAGSLMAIAFRSLETPLGDLLLNAQGKWLSLVGTLKGDDWQGTQRVQFIIEDAVETLLKSQGRVGNS